MKKKIIEGDDVLKCITAVCGEQKIGVLATMGDEGPYQSLVAFAVLPGFREIVFATDRNTTKFRNIKKSHEVSLFIDNRTGKLNDFKNIITVTATGDAYELEEVFETGPGKEYMKCHPLLGEKFLTETAALVNIKVKKFIVVSKFSEVREYFP
ncbi:MAG TPA: pyridoxamine 5'-phosphate oxidase family protein [Spirochaetota bacterium]|nr:pyridoxamine 5'-phosphate oxidase family protein [Spirochaetota bacterium]HPS85704.1 pyridoxamine 5'-phosphate oxidase family protein [Spirochaetota bacterium]